MTSTPAEHRLRMAVRDKLGVAVTITRCEQIGDDIFLEMTCPPGATTLEAVKDAIVAEVGAYLHSEKLALTLHVDFKQA